jgi:hypothetical protein
MNDEHKEFTLSDLNDLITNLEKRSDANLAQRLKGNEEYIDGHTPSLTLYADGRIQTTTGSESTHIGRPGSIRQQDMQVAYSMLQNKPKIAIHFDGPNTAHHNAQIRRT